VRRIYENNGEIEKVAEYEVERLPVYSGTQVSGQIKILSVWRDDRFWYVQIGNGKLYPYANAENHRDRNEFNFMGSNDKPQRWVKI